MQSRFYRIGTSGELETTEKDSALAAWREGSGQFWVDLETENVEDLVEWLKEFGLDPEIITSIAAADSTGRVLALDEMVFFEYPAPDSRGLPYVFSVLCLDRLLITMHTRISPTSIQQPLTSSLRLRETSISGLVCALTVRQSTLLRREALSLRDAARKASDSMDEDPESVPWEDLLTLKRRLLDLDRMTDEEMAVFEVIQVIEKPQLNLVQLAEFFRVAMANVQATDRRLERLDRAVRGLQQRYESVRQDKTNKRLGMLTIISAVFMPLTLIAGIYGMNFDEMPELHYKYSYPITMGGMVAIAAGLIWYFRSRDWLE